MNTQINLDIDSVISVPASFRLDKKNWCIWLVDQTKLPNSLQEIKIQNLEEGIEAILSLRVRGAPAIALFSVFVLILDLRNIMQKSGTQGDIDSYELNEIFTVTMSCLLKTRPTAVNLRNTLSAIAQEASSILESQTRIDKDKFIDELWNYGQFLLNEDKELCLKMGALAADLILPGANILTHCNTGAFATAGIGTAIGAFYTAHARFLKTKQKSIRVYATETRPLLQGARLTVFELDKAGLDVHLVTDSMPAFLMQQGKIDMVMVGADRITKNGDTANKIGTLSLAILCKYFNIPFYVVAPSTTIDSEMESGSQIKIEYRQGDEVRKVLNNLITVHGAQVQNPAFDTTANELITGIITENDIYKYPYGF